MAVLHTPTHLYTIDICYTTPHTHNTPNVPHNTELHSWLNELQYIANYCLPDLAAHGSESVDLGTKRTEKLEQNVGYSNRLVVKKARQLAVYVQERNISRY